MKKLLIPFTLLILTFFICGVLPQLSNAQNLKPNAVNTKFNVNKPVVNKPGIIKKPGLSKSIKAKLPELVVSRLALDSKCRIIGLLQNKGNKLSHADFLKLEIKISYTINGKTKQVVLRTLQSSKTSQPSLLKGTTDRRNFTLGKPVKFTSNLIVPGIKKGFATIRAEIDPENKVRETSSGESKKSVQSRVRSKCFASVQKTTMKISSKVRQKANIPAPSGLSNVTPRSDGHPYITIAGVFISEGSYTPSVWVRLKNTGGEEIDLAAYPALGFHLEVRGKNSWIWSFEQLDPEHTANRLSHIFFDTGKVPSIGDIITIWFSGIAGDRFVGRYGGEIGPIRPMTALGEEDIPSSSVTNPIDIFGGIESVNAVTTAVNYPSGLVRVNQPLIISGNGFGDRAGLVRLTFMDELDRSWPFRIQSWSDDLIIGIITDEAAGFEVSFGVSHSDKRAKLEVIPQGQVHGYEREISVLPDLSWYSPTVTELPAPLAPGQEYDIRGTNLYFDNATYDHTKITLSSRTQVKHCDVTSESRNLIKFVVPEDFFAPGESIEGKITNTMGKIIRFNTNFVPRVQKVITRSFGKYDSDNNSAFCNYDACCKNVAPYRERTTNAFTGKRLINSWKVESSSVEVTRCKCAEINNIDLPTRLCRANIINAPVTGSNNPETRIKARFKPEYIGYKLHVTISGPFGAPHFRE